MFISRFIIPARAASLTTAKDLVSTSRSGVAATHTFTFTTPSTTGIKTILFQFCTTPSCAAAPDMILTAVPTLGSVTGIAGTGYAAAGSSATCTGTGNTNCTITLTVTTPTTQTVTPVTVPVTAGITNPATTNATTFVKITTRSVAPADIDTSTVAFAVLTGTSIAMSASVGPTFTFTVAGVSSGNVNTAATNIVTTANTIPFGTMTSGSTKIGALDTTVVTNALSGYTITVAALATPPLSDGSNHLEVFTGVNATPTSWSSPAGTAPNVNTGFVGYTTEEAALGTGTAARFTTGPPKWAGLITTPEEVVYSAVGGASRLIRIGFQAEINGFQPPGAYSGTVLLVATPTY